MRSSRLAVVLGVLVVGCAPGEDQDDTDGGVDDVAVAVAPSTELGGRPELSDDELSARRAMEPERAQRALAEVETRFAQHDAGLAFRVHRSTTTRYGDAHVLVQQVYRGVPVEQRDILVIVGDDEHVRVLGQPDRFEGVSLPEPGPLDKAHAWAFNRGIKLRGGGERWLQPVFERRLRPGASGSNASDWENAVVRFDAGTVVEVQGGPSYDGGRQLFVRDRDGAVIERELPGHAFAPADLHGRFAQSSGTIPTYVDSTWWIYQLQDEWGNKVYANYNPYIGGDNSWGDGGLYLGGNTGTDYMSPNGETAAADAMISVWGTSKMYQMVYGQTVSPTAVRVHEPNINNAKADPNSGGNGGWSIVIGYVNQLASPRIPLTDVEVVGHEYFHNVFDQKVGAWSRGQGEQDGIYEGVADIFGLNAGFYLSSALDPFCGRKGKFGPVICTWSRTLSITGDWIFGDISGIPGGARSFLDPEFPAFSDAMRQVDGHRALGPVVRMYYFLSVGVLPHQCWNCFYLDNPTVPTRESIYLPQGLTGLGIDVANKIWWHTFDGFYFTSVTSFDTYRTAMLQAATTLYGEYSPQYKAVEDAWAAVNVGKPADRKGPDLDLASGLVMKNGDYIEATAFDENGVAKVEFYFSAAGVGDHKQIGVATAAPWRVGVWSWPSTDTYTLTLEATDTRGNKTVKNYAPVTFDNAVPTVSLTDVTPCSPMTSEWCGDWRTRRRYRVAATDLAGIKSVSLALDGGFPSTRTVASYDFDITYSVPGDHYLRGLAIDGTDKSNQTAWQLYNIDWTPPTLNTDVTIVQSKGIYGDYIDKQMQIDYCASDPSGMALRSGKQRIDVFIDGVPRTPQERYTSAGCSSYFLYDVAPGTHSIQVLIYDKWGNVTQRTLSVTVVAVSPFVFLYGANVDTMVLGNVTVSGFYNSNTGHDIASVAYYVCTSASSCLQQALESPPVHAPGANEFHHLITGLWPGQSYKVQVKVTGIGGRTTTRETVWFTIPTTVSTPPPPPTEHVYWEDDSTNNGYFQYNMLYGGYNTPPSDTTIIRGTAGPYNRDLFRLTAPTNKLLCVAIGADGWAPQIDLATFYRRSDGFFLQALVPGNYPEDYPEDITDDSYSCYSSATDNTWYFQVAADDTPNVDYEIRIKYVDNPYPAAPTPDSE